MPPLDLVPSTHIEYGSLFSLTTSHYRTLSCFPFVWREKLAGVALRAKNHSEVKVIHLKISIGPTKNDHSLVC